MFCIVLLFIVKFFFSTRFIYNAACIILQGCLWGPGRVFILVSLINHFPGRISGASGKGGEGGGGVPAVPPLWPLTAPSNERRHSHTDVLTSCWSPFFPFLLPSSLYSPLFSPSVNSSCAPGTVFVSSLAPTPRLLSLSLFHLSQDPSPPLTHTSLSPAVFSSLTALSCLVLSILCRKQLLNRHFYWSVWKVELLNDCVEYTQSINCILVYSIRNVTHRGGPIINDTHELRTLQIPAISTCTSTDLHPKCHLKDTRLTCLHQHLVINQTAEWPSLTVRFYYLFWYNSGFCPSKETRSVCFLKCSSAWDKKIGADEIRQKIKWHGAIWSPPEHWKLGWGFGVRGSTPYLSALRKNVFAQLFLRDC